MWIPCQNCGERFDQSWPWWVVTPVATVFVPTAWIKLASSATSVAGAISNKNEDNVIIGIDRMANSLIICTFVLWFFILIDMAKNNIECEQYLGLSHSGSVTTSEKSTIELSEEEVPTLVQLIREKETTHVEELYLRLQPSYIALDPLVNSNYMQAVISLKSSNVRCWP